jgi:hypothetical protein
VSGKSGFQHVGQKLECRFVDRQPIRRLPRGVFESADEFAVPAEVGRVARTRLESERTVWPIFNRWVELSSHFGQHVGCREKNRPAVAALGRMADAIRRILREEDGLIHVGRDLAAAEMLAERAVPHQHDLVDVGELFAGRPAAVGAAAIVAQLDQLALVERAIGDDFIKSARHRPLVSDLAAGTPSYLKAGQGLPCPAAPRNPRSIAIRFLTSRRLYAGGLPSALDALFEDRRRKAGGS